MRSLLTLITLACMPAFCQDNAAQKLNDNLRQRLNDILNPQVQAPANAPAIATAPRPLPLAIIAAAPQLCSIPLLNVSAPGKPVPMPDLMPRPLPQPGLRPKPNAPTPNTPATPQSLDRMSIVVPAPACSAKFTAPGPKP